MATLEKIRSKQKLLFTIVIIALFLFIISIADGNSIRNLFGMGPGSTVARVGNVKVDHDAYRQGQELASRQNKNQNQDNDVNNQNVIQQLLMEGLLNEQFDQLGIKVTDAEISRAMTGATPHPAAQQFISGLSQMLQLPTVNGQALLDAITNPARYNLSSEQLDMVAQQYLGAPTMLAAWAAQENNVEQAIRQQVFSNLVDGLFTANQLDARTLYNHNNTVANVSYVTAPYSSVQDKDIEVTDADLKAKYDQVKPMFKLSEPTRMVDYIVVNVQPSQSDLAAAEVEVDQAVESLRNDSNVVLSAHFVADHQTLPVSKMKTTQYLSQIPDSLIKKGSVYKMPMMQNTFRMARIDNISSQIDSINISMYVAENAAAIDSMLNKINAGEANFKALAAENPQVAADSVWQTLVGAPEHIAEMLQNAALGQAVAYNDSTTNSHAIYKVNKRNAPKSIADVTMYTYVVDPSNNTTNDIYTALSSFVASNSTADRFSANADSLYQLRHTRISASTPKLDYMPGYQGMSSGVPGTRHAIQWAMNAKKGEVSPIFDDNNGQYYVVVAVKDIFDGQYMPWDAQEVKDQLTTLVIADKKGAKLVDKYKGKAKDLAGYAQIMGAEVMNDSNVVFTSPRIGVLPGNQYSLQAQVAAAKPGTLVGPVPGASEVMVFVVNGVNKNERPFSYLSDGRAFKDAFGFNDMFTLLAGDRKVENMLLKFENYEGK